MDHCRLGTYLYYISKTFLHSTGAVIFKHIFDSRPTSDPIFASWLIVHFSYCQDKSSHANGLHSDLNSGKIALQGSCTTYPKDKIKVFSERVTENFPQPNRMHLIFHDSFFFMYRLTLLEAAVLCSLKMGFQIFYFRGIFHYFFKNQSAAEF